MKEFTVIIKETRVETRQVVIEVESIEEAESIVAMGINNLGFDEVGSERKLEIEQFVNDKLLDDHGELIEC